MPTPAPSLLLQVGQRAFQNELALLIVTYILAAAFGAASVSMAAWIYHDAKRRGRNASSWLLSSLAIPVAGVLFIWAGISLGRHADFGVGYILWIIAMDAGLAGIWFGIRGNTFLFDPDGKPIHPRAVGINDPRFAPGQPPPSRLPQGPPAGWLPVDAAAGVSGWIPIQPAPRPVAQAPKVKCPNCQTVFSYTPSFTGASRVQCPRCGMTGTA